MDSQAHIIRFRVHTFWMKSVYLCKISLDHMLSYISHALYHVPSNIAIPQLSEATYLKTETVNIIVQIINHDDVDIYFITCLSCRSCFCRWILPHVSIKQHCSYRCMPAGNPFVLRVSSQNPSARLRSLLWGHQTWAQPSLLWGFRKWLVMDVVV